MPDPIGDVATREFTPGLEILVYDTDVLGNQQVDRVSAVGPDAGARYAEAITAAGAWETGVPPDLTPYATTDYVDAQMQAILDAVEGDHHSVTVAEDLGASLAILAADINDVRAALIAQGQPAENAPTAVLGDMIRALNPSAPVNVVPPVLSGAPIAGGTMTVSDGGWVGGMPITYTYRWYLAGSLVGTASSYTTDTDDVGLQLYARVTATNSIGNAFVETAPVTLVDSGDTAGLTADTTAETADSTLITADHEAV